jgi:acyl carrier protein
MQRLEKLVAEILMMKKSDVTDGLSINTAEEWDSLRHMELIVGIEEEFGIKLSTEEIISMVNIKKIKRILNKRGIKI